MEKTVPGYSRGRSRVDRQERNLEDRARGGADCAAIAGGRPLQRKSPLHPGRLSFGSTHSTSATLSLSSCCLLPGGALPDRRHRRAFCCF